MDFLKPKGEGESFLLMKDEKIMKLIKPHYLAFYDMYLVWAWVILLSLFFLSFGGELSEFLGNPMLYVTQSMEDYTTPTDSKLISKMPVFTDVTSWMNEFIVPINSFMRDYTPVGLWITLLFFSAMAISVLKIEWKWILLMVGVGVVSLLLTVFLELPAQASYFFGMMFSVVAIGFVELYRRAHTFYLTDRRIVTEVDWIHHKRNELNYDKINNLILEQNLLGRVFDFGTLIPVTASGIGMGSDFSAVTIGAAGQLQGGPMLGAGVTGGRSIQTPRVRSPYGIFGISDPEKVQHMLSEYMHEHVEAPYLKKMASHLENLSNRMNDKPREKKGDSETDW